MGPDLLSGASWSCAATAPGAAAGPDALDGLALSWMAAAVPGTAAGAVAAASGWRPPADIDGSDWWFRCRIPPAADASPGPGGGTLVLEGLATVADVWVAGRPVAHSENMFVPVRVALDAVDEGDEIAVRFAALRPLLAGRRPRPRWKTQMAEHQSLRWFRTTLLGRQPGWTVTPPPVGPWRPVRLEPAGTLAVVERRVVAGGGDDDTGVVSVMVRLAGAQVAGDAARVVIGGVGGGTDHEVGAGPLAVTGDGDTVVVEGDVAVAGIARWWPHTHGDQPLYAVRLDIGGQTVALGRVGFRDIEVDRGDGGFGLVVNGVPVFCRGACWWPVDPVGLAAGDAALRHTLELVRGAHMNMVRIPGGTVYEDDRFWDLCDELGIMVWQDCMLGYTDPPEDDEFMAEMAGELRGVFGALGGRPALAVVAGGQEIEEQAALFGLARQTWSCTLTEKTIPALAAELLPGIPYVTSSPTGGDLPFQPDAGDCHYWGVGSLLRPPEDARLSGIRFMSEGLAFATPPERQTVEQECGGAVRAGHDPGWKRAVHHDTGRSWDLEDVRDFYVQMLFGTDPHLLRYIDAERALDLGRATVAELMARTLTEWRRPGSTCRGGLVVALRDLAPGAGWGVVDALGRPKAPWYTLARVLAPLALLVTDEGLNGLHLHVVNDTATEVSGRVRLELYARGEARIEGADTAVVVPARRALTLEAGALLEGFRDVSYSYRYGPAPYDVVVAQLLDDDGTVVSEVVHLPAGLDRVVEGDVGLEATVSPGPGGVWTLRVTTRRLAQWVVVEVPGFRASDSWFHLAPGAIRTLWLYPEHAGRDVWLSPGETGNVDRPSGRVRCVNAAAAARLELSS